MQTPDALFDRIAMPGGATPWLAGALTAWLAAAAAIVTGYHWAGAGLVALALVTNGLGQAAARRQPDTAIDILRLPLGLLVMPFGFALADPSRALAAMFLTFALAVWFSLGRHAAPWLVWLIGLGYFAAGLLPDRFSLLAYLLGIACFIAAGQGAVRR